MKAKDLILDRQYAVCTKPLAFGRTPHNSTTARATVLSTNAVEPTRARAANHRTVAIRWADDMPIVPLQGKENQVQPAQVLMPWDEYAERQRQIEEARAQAERQRLATQEENERLLGRLLDAFGLTESRTRTEPGPTAWMNASSTSGATVVLSKAAVEKILADYATALEE